MEAAVHLPVLVAVQAGATIIARMDARTLAAVRVRPVAEALATRDALIPAQRIVRAAVKISAEVPVLVNRDNKT